jgi:hypothetical protein
MVEIEFEHFADTKNKVRFAEVVADGDPEVVGSLYIQKFAHKELGHPQRLKVTIEVAE